MLNIKKKSVMSEASRTERQISQDITYMCNLKI